MEGGGSRQERVRSANSSLSSCTGMYNCLTVYFKRLTESYILRAASEYPQRIRTAMEGGGSRQERVRSANSSLSSCTGMYNCLTVYFKRLTEGLFSERTGCPWFYSEATFLRSKNSRPEVYTDVHFWTGYFKRLTENVFSKAVGVCAAH